MVWYGIGVKKLFKSIHILCNQLMNLNKQHNGETRPKIVSKSTILRLYVNNVIHLIPYSLNPWNVGGPPGFHVAQRLKRLETPDIVHCFMFGCWIN